MNELSYEVLSNKLKIKDFKIKVLIKNVIEETLYILGNQKYLAQFKKLFLKHS